jgi:YHS domain-containing protein
MTDTASATAIDPVCGMTVDVAEAEAGGLTLEHEGETYAFCGRGCFLDFTDDPAIYLDPSYRPSM